MSLDVQQGDVKELFEACDLDASGYIDRHELAAVVDLDPEDLREIFETLDTDEDGRISIDEFTENYNKFKTLAAQLDKDSEKNNRSGNDSDPSTLNQDTEMDVNGRTRPRMLTFDRGKVSLKAKVVGGQEYLDAIYEALAETGNPRLLQALENFVETTSDTLSQKNMENERLDTALRRATEKNTENARNLEEEMEQQITMLEKKIREEERRKAEKAILEAQAKIDEKDTEIREIKDKLEEKLESEQAKEDESEDDLKAKEMENEALKSKLRECQTQIAVFRTEIAQLKNEYDEQGERLSRERNTVLQCVHEQESLTRQLQILHEANRKLHDTNDDLRSALEDRLRGGNDDAVSPVKRHSYAGSPMSAYKRNPLSRSSFDSQSPTAVRSEVTSPVGKADDDYSTMSTPPFRPVENEFNESSLMSELMAADENGDPDEDFETEGILNTSMGLPDGVLPVHNIETDYVDTDAEADPEFVENKQLKDAFKNMTGRSLNTDELQTMPAKEKDQFMEQLRILCETNRRLSKSNDELREALGVLSKKAKAKKSPRSSSRSSHSDYMSSPSRSNSRSSSRNSRRSKTDRRPSTSSPKQGGRSKRKSSHPTTSSDEGDQNNAMATCGCGTEIQGNDEKCPNCGRLQSFVDEDVVKPVIVNDDESAAWLEPDLFADEKCSCNNGIGEICEHCESLRENATNLKSVAIQADLSLDPSVVLENSIHVCEGECCVCCENDDLEPLDKSVQVSEVLLDQAESLIDADSICPSLDLRSEKDSVKCLDCGDRIYDSTVDVCPGCREYRTDVVPPSPFQDNRIENDLQKAPNLELRSSFPDDLDETSNYTDRDTDAQTRVTDGTGADTESIANAARIRQGTRNETTEDESASDATSGINSSYSVIQNIDEELSMFAHQRESDEDIDEDDMTIGELQRIKEMTSSGSDLDSTFEERKEKVETTDPNSNDDVNHTQPERMYKLVLAGDAAVGKSSFILRLCKNKFYQSLNSTLGVDFQMKTINVDGHIIALQLWDTAGQERFRSIAKSYFRRVDGVLLLYDVTSESSFLNVRDWVESITDNSNKPVPIMLCGNKTDLRMSTSSSKTRDTVTTEQGSRLAKEINAFFIETSARNNTNITEAVLNLARQLRSDEDQEIRNGGVKLGENTEAKKKPGCC